MDARDTVNLPAVASAFDSLVLSAFVGGWSPTAHNGRRKCRPLKFLCSDHPVFFCHALSLSGASNMKCGDPQFTSGLIRFDGCRQPSAEYNVFIHIKREVPRFIANNTTHIDHDGEHGKVNSP